MGIDNLHKVYMSGKARTNIIISLNLGIRIGPNLHSVSSVKNNFANAVYWRYSISVCVEIPLLNFYTEPKE